MMYQVCADESYRLDAGGATMVALGGWLSRPDNFQGFCSYWEEVLKAYGAPYFHFSEFANRKHLKRRKSGFVVHLAHNAAMRKRVHIALAVVLVMLAGLIGWLAGKEGKRLGPARLLIG